MNYQTHYNNLIDSRKKLFRKKGDGNYYESHHIIMKSMGGTDDSENLILLTAKEHFLAHKILHEIYKNRSTAYALFRLCLYDNENKIKITSGRSYEYARKIYSVYASETMKSLWEDPDTREKLSIANGNKNRGRKHTEQSRKNMSDAHKGFKPKRESIEKARISNTGKKRTEDLKRKMSELHKGRKYSEEIRKKMSDSAKTRIVSEDMKALIAKKASERFSKPRVEFELISPEGNISVFKGFESVKQFAKENKISISLLHDFLNKGKIKSKSARNIFSNDWEIRSMSKNNTDV